MRIIREPRMSTNMKLLLLLLASILFMGIGYSAMNSITGEIEGVVIAEAQEGVFITNVEYVSNVDANLATSEIKYYEGTMMQSSVQLSGTNSASEITYKVTVYNNSENSLPFLGVLYDEEFYDNTGIIFEISEDGYSLGEIINPKESKDIYITFKYKDGIIPENTILNSYLNFKIAEPNRMVMAEYVDLSDESSLEENYLESSVSRYEIETISFELGNIQPAGTIASFDASEKQDKSIIGYYTDTDGNGLYELTFASNEIIFANTNAQFLFLGLTSLKEITFDNFSTYDVTNMQCMFLGCMSLTSLDVSKFDTSQVTDMSYMFDSCIGLTSLDLSNFDTSKVTDMSSMFFQCIGLTSLDLSNFDTSQVTDMSSMFDSCIGLTSLDVSNFDTSKVTDMSSMFSICEVLTSLDLSNFNTSQVTSMSSMFQQCKSLTSLDLSNFDTSKVTNMRNMFYYCESLTSLDVSNFDTSQVTDMSSMFNYCSSLTSLDLSNFDTSQVTDMGSMFFRCESLTSLDVSSFDTSKVTYMGPMFSGCRGLTSLDVSKFNTSQVTDMNRMFDECSSLTSLDVSSFDTSQVTSMSSMFQQCESLTSLDVSSFDTSQVTSMYGMFYDCRSLTSLDLSSFNTSKVTNMTDMFRNCSSLTTIYVSEFDSTTNTGWTTSAVTKSVNMFSGSSKIVGGNGTTYDSAHTDAEYARIDKTGTPGYFTNITERPVSPSEIFDADGTNSNGLHIGDFINYDAGTWTQEEINAIKTGKKTSLVTANGSTSLPSKEFQFGGFAAGSSRNGNATPNETSYNYVKDASTGEAITGWRVFDIEGDTVTLISAGNPEAYRLIVDGTNNYAYISEYILTGNINSDWSNGATQAQNYQIRNWSNYVNTAQKAEGATVLTKSRLDDWYTKYTDTPNADTANNSTFQKIYNDSAYYKYQNMIDNYSNYWLFPALAPSMVPGVDPERRYHIYYEAGARGLRVLVTLSSEAKLKKTGMKTVTGGNTTSYGGDQTYNVWDIK